MANTLYNIGREGFLRNVVVGTTDEQTNWMTDFIRVALVDENYPEDVLTHTSYNDIGTFVAADEDLTGRDTDGAGTVSADTITFTAVPPGDAIASVVIYKSDNDGVPTDPEDCPLIAFLDEAASGLPIVPNGGDITVLWNSGSGEIFRI